MPHAAIIPGTEHALRSAQAASVSLIWPGGFYKKYVPRKNKYVQLYSCTAVRTYTFYWLWSPKSGSAFLGTLGRALEPPARVAGG